MFVGAPTVADDIAILSDTPSDLATALQTIHNFTKKDRSNINSSKSSVVIFNANPKRTPVAWPMGNDIIPECEESTHLGITRNKKRTQDINNRISIGRKALYALMGAGLHGRNGVNPKVSLHMYCTFARPRVIYGLEVVNLSRKEISQLENFEIQILRQIQYLPDRCPALAVYSLLGATPISSQIDINALTLFGSIIRSQGSIEKEVAVRQLAIKEEESKSWFIYIRKTLNKYDLPSAYDLLSSPPTRNAWKSAIKEAVNNYWRNEWTLTKSSKNSLRFLSIQDDPTLKPHLIWDSIDSNPRHVKEAVVKARLLTGTYTLQANRHKFNQFEVPPTCKLCHSDPEDRQHFLTQCKKLDSVRNKHLPSVLDILNKEAGSNVGDTIGSKPDLLTQCIIDCSAASITLITGCNHKMQVRIEKQTRALIYDLHTARNKHLQPHLPHS